MKKLIVYYDKECPFCSKYSELVKLRSHYDVEIINARECHDTIQEFKTKGLDINEGFIIQIEDQTLQGEEAVVFLSKHMKTKNSFEKTILWFMKKRTIMNIIYPIVKTIRIIVLWLIGRDHRIKF